MQTFLEEIRAKEKLTNAQSSIMLIKKKKKLPEKS